MDVIERARRYIGRMDAAVAGSDGHTTTFKVALVLVKGFGLSVEEARPLLREYNERCLPPWSDRELEHKLRQADGAQDDRERGWLCQGAPRERREPGVADRPRRESGPKRPPFDLGKLSSFAEGCRMRVDRDWLYERSPVRPEWGARPGLGVDFLSMLYGRDEVVLIFTDFRSQGDFAFYQGRTYRLAAERGVQAVRSEIPTGGKDGMWYLTNPVSGKWEPQRGWNEEPTRWSRRSGACVTSWRYAVLESDSAPDELWLRALVQLKLPIAAIYTSGGKSVHALIRVDAASKADFDRVRDVLVRALCPIGADGAAISGVRLSRLPGCVRGNRPQELWYLDPRARWGRLMERLPVRVRGDEGVNRG